MQRYLRSVRPLLDDENYDRMTGLAKDFEQGLGKRLQRYLRLKHFWSKNYVSDWWEEYVYLRCRGPLMIKSNFYGTCPLFVHPTCLQAARAANNIALLLTFRQKMDRQDQRPVNYDNSHDLEYPFDVCGNCRSWPKGWFRSAQSNMKECSI